MEGRIITLAPLSPREAHEDQLKIRRENRKKCESEISKEFVKKESDQKKVSEKENGERKEKVVRVVYCSNQQLMELEPKENCFITNDINSTFFQMLMFLSYRKMRRSFPSLSIT